MFKVHGVNMFPAQVEEVLRAIPGVSSEYAIALGWDENTNKDVMMMTVEADYNYSFENLARTIQEQIKSRIGVTPKVNIVPVGTLPRSEKKTKRVTDYRY